MINLEGKIVPSGKPEKDLKEKEIIHYLHHNKIVAVRKDLKGRHREFCICYQCEKLNIDDPESNCKIAEALYGFDKLTGTTTPVFECPEFVSIDAVVKRRMEKAGYIPDEKR